MNSHQPPPARFTRRSALQATLGAASGLAFPGLALAQELSAGFVLEKSSIEGVLNSRFEGHTIKDLLPESVLWQIREANLKIVLKASEPLKLAPQYKAYTEQNKTKVKLNEKKLVEGWQAGQPFPVIDPKDPDAGIKVAYNNYYGDSTNHSRIYRSVWQHLVDGKKGVERTQGITFRRFFYKGRYLDKNPTLGDGTILNKTLLVVTEPFDIKGLGQLIIRRDSPDLDESYLYVKSFRRTRRLDSTSWIDPQPNGDQLIDDIDIYNAHPLWYKSHEFLGEKTLLMPVHSGAKLAGNGSDPKNHPWIDTTTAPYWGTKLQWEPVKVRIVKATPPDFHPYGHKIVYWVSELSSAPWGEYYDKSGKLWRTALFHYEFVKGENGRPGGYLTSGQVYADWKRMHGMAIAALPSRGQTDDAEDVVSMAELEKIAK